MMNPVRKTICTLFVLAASSTSVMAVETTNLAVTGMIAPAACVPSFSGGGVVDYGAINTKNLSLTGYNVLPSKQIDFSITCSAPAQVGFTVISGRPSTLAGIRGSENSGGFGYPPVRLAGGTHINAQATGIGLDTVGNKIGGMAMNIRQGATTLDGSQDVRIIFGDDTQAFRLKTNDRNLHPTKYSWSSLDNLTPLAFTTLSSAMNVQVFLNKGQALDLTKEINVASLVTVELLYL